MAIRLDPFEQAPLLKVERFSFPRMKHVHICGRKKTVEFECDHCGSPIASDKRAPARCVICGRDLCPTCKRFLHLEAGSGKAPGPTISRTWDFCPECYARRVASILREVTRWNPERGVVESAEIVDCVTSELIRK